MAQQVVVLICADARRVLIMTGIDLSFKNRGHASGLPAVM